MKKPKMKTISHPKEIHVLPAGAGEHAMTVGQVKPAARALEGVGMGDILRHFRVASDSNIYWVAVLETEADRKAGLRRTNCTCWDAWTNFANAGRKPCCMHAEACIEQLRRDEALEFAALAAKEKA